MIDSDKLAEGIKSVVRTAEEVFVKVVGDKPSSDSESSSGAADNNKATASEGLTEKLSFLKEFDVQQVMQLVQEMVGDYIRQHQDFSARVPVKIKAWSHFKGPLPSYESAGASGLDVRAQLSEALSIEPGQRVLVPTGLSMEVPQAYEIQARPRSGLALKKGLSLVNTPGTIDADYRGEIKIIMINLGQETVIIEDQERVAQLVICPVVKADFEWVEDLSQTERGEGGFGSTGSN